MINIACYWWIQWDGLLLWIDGGVVMLTYALHLLLPRLGQQSVLVLVIRIPECLCSVNLLGPLFQLTSSVILLNLSYF